ncbi:putative MFS transporter [Coniochaeta sp. 2T2.1]|nr:putative MFS transporter [Coniochaeta sp. 2T2.1]
MSRVRLGIIIACFLLIILLELGAYLATIPLNQVLEENICRSFHPQLPPNSEEDPRCKGKAVQAELSIIRGWQSTVDVIPGLLTAVPYGFLADRRGREMVLGLSLVGITLTSACYILICALPGVFPPRVTWLSSVFTFIGGGPAVTNAMLFTIAGDVVSLEQRSITFSYLSAAVVGGELIASPLVYFLMEVDIWLCIYIGLSCLVLGTGLTFLLPETLPRQQLSRPPPEDTASPPWHDTVRSELANLGQAVSWVLWRDWRVALLLCTLFVTTLGRFAHEILLQYVTKRYGWSWAQASLLLSIRAFFTLALFTVLIPSASYVLVRRWSNSAPGTNLWLARASVMLLTVGALTIGLSTTSIVTMIGLGIFALGSGYNFLVRSLLASVVENDHIGMLYTVIGICETVGILVAGPLLAASFRTGMDWGGDIWLGLPYLAAGSLFAVAATAYVNPVLGNCSC